MSEQKTILDEVLADLWLSLQASLPENIGSFVHAEADEKLENLVVTWDRKIEKAGFAALLKVVQGMGGDYVNLEGDRSYLSIPRPKVEAKPEGFKPASEAVPAAAKEKKEAKPAVARLPSPPGLYVAQNCQRCDAKEHCHDPANPEPQRICLEVQQLTAYRCLVEEVHLLHGELMHLSEILKEASLKPRTWDGSTPPQNATPNSTSNATSHSTSQHSAVQRRTVEDARILFPEDLDAMLSFEDKGDCIKISPKQFLGAENFAKIATAVKGIGGEYVSAGKESHFRITNGSGPSQQPQQTVPRNTRPTVGHVELGLIWTNELGSNGQYEKASEKDNKDREEYFKLEDWIISLTKEGKKPFQDGFIFWLFDQGAPAIGRKKTQPQRGRR